MTEGLVTKIWNRITGNGNGHAYRDSLEVRIRGQVQEELKQLRDYPNPEERETYLRVSVEEFQKELDSINGSSVEVNPMLDDQPADEGKKKTQNQHIKYWNKIEDGRVMASMGELYVCFQQLKSNYETGTSEIKEKIDLFLADLRDDFDYPKFKNWLISSTRLNYSADDLKAKITQHYNCQNKSLIKETELKIPEYRGTKIAQVITEPRGLRYLQTLFDTEDSGDEIIEVLEFVSGKKKKEIKVWTAAVKHDKYFTRSERSERAAGFGYGDGGFRVDGGSVDVRGRSRGVQKDPVGTR